MSIPLAEPFRWGCEGEAPLKPLAFNVRAIEFYDDGIRDGPHWHRHPWCEYRAQVRANMTGRGKRDNEPEAWLRCPCDDCRRRRFA